MASNQQHGEQHGHKARVTVSILSVAVVLSVGLPIWWHTTTVYRATLPYQDIEQLKYTKISVMINVSLIFISHKQRDDLINLLTTQLNTEDNLKESSDVPVEFLYFVNGRQSTNKEDQVLFSLINPDYDSVDDHFQKLWSTKEDETNMNYKFLLLPKDGPFSFMHYLQCFIGKYHHAMILYDDDTSHLAEKINHVMKNVFIQKHSILQSFHQSFTQRNATMDSIVEMRDLKSTTGFHLSFSLINDEPETGILTWNIKERISDNLQPLLDKIPHFDITFDSQVLHYSGVNLPVKRDGDINYVTSKDLPHMINPIEAKLGSFVSLNPSLNFIVFVPSMKQSPVKIKLSDGTYSSTNAFLSPRWGGVVIYNMLNRSDSPKMMNLDVMPILEIFVSQIRLLIGIRPTLSASGTAITSMLPSGARDWEVDNLLLTKTMEYLASTIKTLTSLTQLIDKVKNMVIADHIKEEIEVAVGAINQCRIHLSHGNQIPEAFFSAKKALQSSERAFFDPSVLELLYFPDDQKFAIYIPLFLPVSLPLLISFVAAIKWFRNPNNEN